VLLHISRLAIRVELVLDQLARELPQDLPEGFAAGMCEDGESASMGHPNADLFDLIVDGPVEDGFQANLCRLHTLDAETFGSRLLLAEVFLKGGHFSQPLQQFDLILAGLVPLPLAEGLCLFADKYHLLALMDVLDVPTDVAAVGLAQVSQDAGELHGVGVGEDSSILTHGVTLHGVVADHELVV